MSDQTTVSSIPSFAAQLLDCLPLPAMLLDASGRVLAANAAASHRLRAVPGRQCCENRTSPDRDSAQCPIPIVLRDRQPRTCQIDLEGARFGLRIAAVDGSTVLASLADNAPPIQASNEPASLLSAILDATSDAVIACDLDHRIEFVNRALVESSGVPAATLTGKNARELWPPSQGHTWEEIDDLVLKRGERVRFPDLKYDHSLTGKEVWVDVTFSPRTDAEGRVVGTVMTVHNLTSERVLASRLAESEARYRQLFENAPVGLVIVGADRCTKVANPAALLMFGGADRVLGRPFDEFIAPEDRERMLDAFERVVRTGRRLTEGNEFAIVMPTGERREVFVRTSDIVFEGKPALQSVLVDVTQRRQLERKLVQAEKMASLGNLAAGVSHEFNNVLAAIQGRAEIIGRTDNPGLIQDCAKAVVRHCRRGAEIVEEVAGFSASRPLKLERVSWEDAAAEILQSLEPRLEAERIHVERDFAATRAALADRGQVFQLVTNLLQNARDAMRPKGGGVVRVATRDVADGVELSISDTGVGIDDSARHRVFEPFFTTKTSADRRGGLATGLGLAIVHGVVQAHGGRIDVESELGKGTTFRVTFVSAELTAAPKVEPRQPDRVAGVPLQVIVVDDDPDVTEMIEMALAHHGHTARAVNNPLLVAEECRRSAADVLVIDYVMPQMDGIELLRRLRTEGIQTPAVLLTGRNLSMDDEALKDLGVSARLVKPVDLDTIFTAIQMAAEIAGASPTRSR